jgi:hypothetical protein
LKYTQNYNLRKPEDTDPADIQDLNYNADEIDAKLKELEDEQTTHEQATNPHNITPEGIGAETPTGAQQKANNAFNSAKSYVVIVASDLSNQAETNAKSYADQVASDLSHKLNETRIKVLDVEQDVSNISKVLTNLNPNQEAKQSVSGYGILSLPKNAANGQVSASVKGNTYTNLLGTKGLGNSLDGWLNATNITIVDNYIDFDVSNVVAGQIPVNIIAGHTYFIALEHFTIDTNRGLIIQLSNGTLNIGNTGVLFTTSPTPTRKGGIFTATAQGNNLRITRGVGDNIGKNRARHIMLVNLTLLNETETDINKLLAKYPYVNGTKSTISASRLKSVGKNFNKCELSTLYKKEFKTSNNTSNDFRVYLLNSINTSDIHSYTTFISGQFSRPITVSQSKKYYIRLGINGSAQDNKITFTDIPIFLESGTYTISFTGLTISVNNVNFTSMQLEKGTVATPYEPYTESTQYFTAKDSVGKIIELRSLPNGTKDEVRVSEGKLIKRVSDEVKLWEVLDTVLSGGESENFYALSGSNILTNLFYESSTNIQFARVNNYPGKGTSSYPEVQETDNYIWRITSTGTINIKIPKADIEGDFTVAKGQQWLQQKQVTLTYQLATPIEIPIQTSGSLVSYPSGTVYIEPFVADAGIYTDKMEVLYSDLPIKVLEKLSKIDFTTGLETELDVSDAVIAENKLSFTHPDLTSGDIVFFVYEHGAEGTLPETEISYYDSRYVIKGEDDKFYKWEIEAKLVEGVITPSIKLVEV